MPCDNAPAHVDYIKRVNLGQETAGGKKIIGHYPSDIKDGSSNEGIATCMSLLLQKLFRPGLWSLTSGSIQVERSRWASANELKNASCSPARPHFASRTTKNRKCNRWVKKDSLQSVNAPPLYFSVSVAYLKAVKRTPDAFKHGALLLQTHCFSIYCFIQSCKLCTFSHQ